VGVDERIFSNFVSTKDHLKYKYLINVDGDTCSWTRVPMILLSGSVMIWQYSEKTEWFLPYLIPWKHYVPVKADLSDLYEKIEWLRNNDEEAK